MSPKESFTQLSLGTLNLGLKSYSFCLHFILYLHVCGSGSVLRIRILKVPEYESNTDPYVQHCLLMRTIMIFCFFKFL